MRALVLATLVLVAARPVAAQAVEVPEGCGSEAELREELTRLLGAGRADEAWPEQLRIEKDEQGGYALELVLRGETRQLRDADCRALFKTAVVVAAVVVDPTVAQREKPESDSETETEIEPEPETEPEAETEPDSEPDPLRFELAIGGGAAVGVQPRLAPVVDLAVAVAIGPLGVQLGGRYLLEAQGRSAGRAVDVDGFGARLLGFYDVFPWLRLGLGLGLDQLQGRGTGQGIASTSDTGTLMAIAAEASAHPLTIGQLRVSIALSGQYALARPSFEIRGYGTVYQVPAVGAALLMRLGWAFL